MPRKGSTVQVPDGWLQVIRGPRPPSNKWPTRNRQSSKPPAKGRRGSQVIPPPEASHRGPSSGGSCVVCQGTSVETGGGNGSCGRVRPYFLAFARCVEESEGTVSSAPRGGSHCCFERVCRESEEEDHRLSSRSLPRAGGVCEGFSPSCSSKSKDQPMEMLDWRHSSRSLQRQGQEWRKFPRHCPPILPTSFKSYEHVCQSYAKRTQNCVRNCSQVEEKSGNANIPDERRYAPGL